MENDLSSYGSLGRIISSKGRGSRGINGPFHGLVAEFSVPRQKKSRITSAEKIQTQFYLERCDFGARWLHFQGIEMEYS